MSPWLKKITSHVCKVVFFIRHPSSFRYQVFSNVFIISGTKLQTLQTKVDQNLISDPLKIWGFLWRKTVGGFRGSETGVGLLCLEFLFWYCGFNLSCIWFVLFIWNKNAELDFQLVKYINGRWLSPVYLLWSTSSCVLFLAHEHKNHEKSQWIWRQNLMILFQNLCNRNDENHQDQPIN